MATRYLKTTLQFSVATNKASTETNINRSAPLMATIDGSGEHQESGIVAHNSTYTVPFGQVTTARAVLIEADGALEVRMDGATTGVLIRPIANAKMAGVDVPLGRFYLEGEVDSIVLVNASNTINVNFAIYLLGDLV